MSWNYRVVKSRVGGQVRYGIHEVYYDSKGKPKMYTQDTIPLDIFNQEMTNGNEKKAKSALTDMWTGMGEALLKPVLTAADFKKKTRKK